MLLACSISILGFPNELTCSVCLKLSLLSHPVHSGFALVADLGNYEEAHEQRASALFARSFSASLLGLMFYLLVLCGYRGEILSPFSLSAEQLGLKLWRKPHKSLLSQVMMIRSPETTLIRMVYWFKPYYFAQLLLP